MNPSVSPEAAGRARQHLYVALRQVAPLDDHIIVEHMRDAYVALGGAASDVPLPWEIES